MINEVLTHLNNYFYKYTLGTRNFAYTKDMTFTGTDTIAGAFTDTFIVGEYVKIENSRLNDGVYLITANGGTTLTIDASLDIAISTEAEISCIITKLYIPKHLVALIADIKTYEATANNGVMREKQGSREIDYASDSTWNSVFAKRLSKYKKLGW